MRLASLIRTASVCSLVIIAPSTSPARERNTFLFSGDSWKLRISDMRARYSHRLGSYREEWEGPIANVRPRPGGGVEVTGTLERAYVVAGEAVTDELPFTLEVTDQPCEKQPRAKMSVTAILTFKTDSVWPSHDTGCGAPMPLPVGGNAR